MLVTDPPVPTLLKERADQRADTTAYTYMNYGLDPKGFAESLAWSQVHGRACIIAEELKLRGSPGDRVAILAPRGLEYVTAFLGALQAGFIAFPRYCGMPKPVAILTASSVTGGATKYACAQVGQDSNGWAWRYDGEH
jgi:long-chain fatty acid adenylase/transferase FadD26